LNRLEQRLGKQDHKEHSFEIEIGSAQADEPRRRNDEAFSPFADLLSTIRQDSLLQFFSQGNGAPQEK